MNARPLSDIVSPVTPSELQDWLGLPTLENKLAALLSAATEIVITHIGRDLIQRNWRVTLNSVADFRGGYTRNDSLNGYPFVELPFSGLVSVASATSDGTLLTLDQYETDVEKTPGRIHFYGRTWAYNIVVNYTAGMAPNAAGIPEAIKAAIKMIASYLHAHLGECDTGDALKESGAITLLKRFRVERL